MVCTWSNKIPRVKMAGAGEGALSNEKPKARGLLKGTFLLL